MAETVRPLVPSCREIILIPLFSNHTTVNVQDLEPHIAIQNMTISHLNSTARLIDLAGMVQ